MKVIKKIEFQNEEIASVRLAQKIMLQACDEIGNNSCFNCPFFQKNGGDGTFICIEDLISEAINEMENKE